MENYLSCAKKNIFSEATLLLCYIILFSKKNLAFAIHQLLLRALKKMLFASSRHHVLQ